MIQITKIQLRRGNSESWLISNPILAEGEPGYDTDVRSMKIGDGVTRWAGLPFSSGAEGQPSSAELLAHILDPTPHQAYDDIPDLTLLFENGLI